MWVLESWQLLQHKLKRVLNDLLQLLDPLATNGAVHDLVVEATGHDDLVIPLSNGAFLGLDGDSDLADGADGQNTGLRRVDDGGEALNGGVHTHVADGEGTALVLLGLELVLASTLAEVADLVRDARQTQSVSTLDDRGDQAGGGGDGDTDIGGLVLADDNLAVDLNPARVDLGNLQESGSTGLDQEVVDGQLVLAIGGGVQGLAELEELGDRQGGGHEVVGVLLHRLLQAVGNGLAHGADGDVLVGGASGGGGAGLVLLDIFLGDHTTPASTLEGLDRDALLKGESLGGGGDGRLTVQGRLELLIGVLGLNSGGLRRGGRSRRLSALGLLLLLGGWSSVVTSILQGEGLEGRDIGTLLNKNGNGLLIGGNRLDSEFRGESREISYRADRDLLLARLLQDLGEDTLILELEVHLGLIGLNLDQDITGLEAVTGLLLPRANISSGHCRGQRRHADNGVRREGYIIIIG